MSQSLFAKTSLGGGFKPLTRTTPKLDGTSSTYTERVQALDVAAARTPADKINRTLSPRSPNYDTFRPTGELLRDRSEADSGASTARLLNSWLGAPDNQEGWRQGLTTEEQINHIIDPSMTAGEAPTEQEFRQQAGLDKPFAGATSEQRESSYSDPEFGARFRRSDELETHRTGAQEREATAFVDSMQAPSIDQYEGEDPSGRFGPNLMRQRARRAEGDVKLRQLLGRADDLTITEFNDALNNVTEHFHFRAR